MQYLFFDIECACVFREVAKICAFGYCLTDEQFNIIEKQDLLMNPKGNFHLTDGSGKDGIVLPYEYGEFVKYPTFKQYYDRIKGLLEDKNTKVFGHATFNDVKYLNLETRRFKRPPFNFYFYDTQLLYMSMINSFEKQIGLEGAAQNLQVEFVPHRAVDDAYATMTVAAAMCKKEGCGMEELLQKYGVKPGRTCNGQTTLGTSAPLQAYEENRKKAKMEKVLQRLHFGRLVDSYNRKKSWRQGKWSGKVFTFSKEIEGKQGVETYLQAVYQNGGKYSSKLNNSTVYVHAENDCGKRYLNAQKANMEIWEEKAFADLIRSE